MTHILIVDDERLERLAMKKILMTAFPEVQEVGEARTGGEAVSYAEQKNPDLVLMDIKMPGMDGLQAIQEIKKHNEQTRFIMVSAFDTFEYAQQAIREGVKDYLVKPSKKEEIIETVSRVLQELEKEKEKLEKEEEIQANYYRALSQLQTDWVAGLLLNHINRESFYLEAFSVGDFQQFVAMVIDFQPRSGNQVISSEDQTRIYREFENLINSICQAAIGPLMSFQIPVLLPFNEDGKEASIQSRATAIARKLLKIMEKAFPDIKCGIGIGTPVEDVYQFSDSYQKAILALGETTANVNYMVYHPSILSKRSETKLNELENLLLESIRAGDSHSFEKVFYEFFAELSAFYDHSIKNIMQHLDEMRVLLNRYLKEWHSDYLLPEHAFNSETYVLLRERARSQLLNLVQYINNWQTERSNGVIYKAKDWIDAHFCEAVTLDDVAAEVQLSPYYFSKLFKEHYGQTFIDYLTQKRIELSKSLLINTEKTFKEICFEVGYHDPNYFSRVFKKMTGKTPSDYRKNGLTLS
ncbi:response regulator [Pullulanibacillus sp. KACC 23026]|uniref:response regulator n=1 Tax=Pullulanibacillus sp. KACC 23026 TaxID=3028315 RepID=UPI0023B09AAC|nr:response regulator [Pullulanibacillus sp. KACC 23026]WEG14752.1 response regulator [Pullulanibacillus sp. KACC 23026]